MKTASVRAESRGPGRAVGVLAGVVAMGLAFPSTAAAEDLDIIYFQQLRDLGANLSDFALARDQGRQSCAMLDKGRSFTDALASLASAGPYSRDETIAITTAAIIVYCPWHSPT
ncbi:DUF732 domain-containing protein [Mycobacterium sp. NPDC051804]|uniref:DUF732 domain-containing protein n=1 Tax=Mycobacterium sp. NPDC051804 TaxID=3364295 RepID=UPI0037A2DF70